MSLVNEGDILMVDFPGPGRHPAVVISDQVLINSSTEVVVALVTTRIRGYSVEWPIAGHGLAESVVRCDNLFTIRKADLGERLGTLGVEELDEVRRRVGTALGIA